ncbi:ABC transporter permease [Kosakonia radicincitans]|uniref:ABC transporter permease n=1 Tax=Kosakonia TaxID=1330547 RepID=UPI00090425A2|nr:MULTISPECIES: ABC transporter permease [Kosakonia]APG19689.1 hypothetical protein A3780_19775 [Kosakonia radicincitans]MDD7995984.1 ABC transporter permease [Kosakonia radicincitans]NCF05970.1 ABC transporter permease [Kosakonia sp. MH5]QEM89975.1 ABC transporter permease [Kosakonia radicincitans]
MNKLKLIYERVMAIIVKELFELRRDKVSLLMIFAIPLINLCIIGFSVNTDPKFVRTALIDHDVSSFSRTLVTGMTNTDYFAIQRVTSEQEADKLFREGAVQLVVIIPAGFSRDLIAARKPQLLVQTDASDPAATANATQALTTLLNDVFRHDTKNLPGLQKENIQLVDVVVHKLYNPEGITRLNIVPGLAGVILSMILILMTSLSIIREREKDSIMHIINSPVTAWEIMLGKVFPYFCVGLLQAAFIVMMAVYVMDVPIMGSFISLALLLTIFIILCLAIGVIFSTVTKSQLQVMQLASFYFLLSTMLSGFMNTFYGMPFWSQLLGSVLPLTYFLRLVRGIMLKGYALNEMSPDFMSLLFLTVFLSLLCCILFHRVVKKL